MTDLKKMYTTILGDSFPMDMTISFGDQQLVYRKKTWKINMETTMAFWRKIGSPAYQPSDQQLKKND